MKIDAATFARWTWERDCAVIGFREIGPFSKKTKANYLEEAWYYMDMPQSEWPCGILLKMGGDVHFTHHKDCPTTDPLE